MASATEAELGALYSNAQEILPMRQLMKAARRNEAYRRLGYATRKNVKQQNINKILVPSSWPTVSDYNPDQPLDLQVPKQITDPDDWRTVTCPAKIELMLKL